MSFQVMLKEQQSRNLAHLKETAGFCIEYLTVFIFTIDGVKCSVVAMNRNSCHGLSPWQLFLFMATTLQSH